MTLALIITPAVPTSSTVYLSGATDEERAELRAIAGEYAGAPVQVRMVEVDDLGDTMRLQRLHDAHEGAAVAGSVAEADGYMRDMLAIIERCPGA